MKRRRPIIALFFIALLLLIAHQITRIFLPFFQPIFWAAVLAFAFHPLYQTLKRSFHHREALASATTTVLIFLVLAPIAVFIVLRLAAETSKVYNGVLVYVKEGHLSDLAQQIHSLPVVHKIETQLANFPFVSDNYQKWLLGSAKALAKITAKRAAIFTKNILLLPLKALLTFFLVFFFLKDGQRIYAFVYDITPMEEANKKIIFKQVNDTFAAVIRGQVFTALAQASVAGAVFWVLGLPLPIFFAALTFLVALIPIIGACFVWVPFEFYLLALHQYQKAVLLLFLGLFGISFIDNLLKPYLIGEKTKLPYPLLFLGILGGVQIYGLVGIFLAPAVLSVFFVLIKIYREKFL